MKIIQQVEIITALGKFSLSSNTTGTFNTAIGLYALRNNTTGTQNTAIGNDALFNVTTGGNNIAIGHNTEVPDEEGDNQIRMGSEQISYAGIQVAWTITSDKRWKNTIKWLNHNIAEG